MRSRSGRGKELWKPINYVSAAIDHCRKDPASAGERDVDTAGIVAAGRR